MNPATAAGPGPARMAKNIRRDEQEVGAHPRAPEPRPHVEVQQHQERHHQHQLDPVGAGDAHRAESFGVASESARRAVARRRGCAVPRRAAAGAAAAAPRLAAAASESARRSLRPPASESARRISAIESSRIASSAESLGKRALEAGAGRRDQHQDVGDRAGIGRGKQAVDPLPPGLLAHHAGHGAHRNPLGIHPAETRGEHQRARRHRVAVGHAAELERALPHPGSESDGATTPLALPPTVYALTRNSGWAQVMTTLERSAGAQHHADQALGRHHRVELRDQVAPADVEEQGPAVGGLGLVQDLGGDVRRGDAAAQREQLAEPLVLGDERGNALGEVGGGVALDGDGLESGAAGPSLLSARLEPDQRGQHGAPEACRRCPGPRPKEKRARPGRGRGRRGT